MHFARFPTHPLLESARWAVLLGSCMLAVGLAACQPSGDAGEDEAAADSANAPPVVEITAADYAYAAPDTIPAGWVTFRMKNRGEESHHFHLDRLPEGRTYAEFQEVYGEPVDSVMGLVAEGEIALDEAGAVIDRVTPDWTDSVQTHGGVGLVAPGRTGQATHRVEPGHHLLVCTIRAPSGRVHAELGMVDGLVAVESSVGRSPPEPDATVRAAGREIRTDGTLTPGTQTIGFSAEEVPEELRGGTDGYYSAWLARLEDTTDAAEVAAWEAENPAPYEAIGGFEYLPPDQAAYMTADVQPGRYAWIWFYEGMDLLSDDEPIVKEFTVENPAGR